MSEIDEAAIARDRLSLEYLMRCRPDDSPEILPSIAGGVCGLNPYLMDLLADTAVQVTQTAHGLAQEVEDVEKNHEDEAGPQVD